MDIEELFGFGDDSAVLTLVWILPVIILVLYGQRIQLYVTSSEIGKKIKKLGVYASDSRDELVTHASSEIGPNLEKKLDQFLDYFTIMPVGMDPAGMVDRVRHVIRLRDDSTRRHICSLAPDMAESGVARTQALIEVSATLRAIHSVMNHMFLTAKRQKNYPLILPLQMILPFVMEQAEALSCATAAFRRCVPVGDSIGPAVVGSMMVGLEKREAAFQTIAADSELEGRRLVLIKARGPMPTVGRVSDALGSLIKGSKPDAIVMVDAALKLEGEESGIVAHGFGAAIGGSGVERAEIEALATSASIPVHSVIIKQSVIDALSPMSKVIADSALPAREALRVAILDNTKSGQLVVVIGVGNTSGVLQ